MTWTLTTSGAAILKAGANASTAITTSGSALLTLCTEAEGMILTETRKDFITNYSSLPDGIKNILSRITSAEIAKNIISYDMAGYTSRQEAGTMLDVLDDQIIKGMTILKDFKLGDSLRDP